jgi:uncharacterized membrane protein
MAGATLFAGAALELMAAALVITLAVNVPIDRQIQSWTTATLPTGWTAIRDRWEFYHGLRTLMSLAALPCLFLRTLSTRISPDHQTHGGERRGTPRPLAASTFEA